MDAERQQESNQPETLTARPRPFWWRVIGLRRRHGKRIAVGLTLWGWILVGLLFLVVGGAGFAEYSMQPEFCRSCHLMEPYYEAWHSSTHANVPCGDCHFEPGWEKTVRGKFEASSQAVKYLTNTYGSKPHAEVRDVSCLRTGCHERRVLEGKVAWEVQSQRGVKITIRFNHTPHLTKLRRGKKLRCVSCHSQIVQGQHLVVTLDTCFICHFKGLKHGRDEEVVGGCRGCHEAPRAEIRLKTGVFEHGKYLDRGVTCENCHSDSIRGDGAVPRQRCWSCHNKPHQLARYGETKFIHKMHVTDHKVECAECHIQIEHHLTAGVPRGGSLLGSGGSCGACHENTHDGPMEIYRGRGGRGVPDMPSPMFRAQVDCIACHHGHEYPRAVAEVMGQTFTATQDRCNYCHGNQYEGTLAEWKDTIATHLERAEVAYEEATAAVGKKTLPAVERLRRRRWLDDAAHNIRLVKLGHGVHNVTYATALLNIAIENCRQVIGGPLPRSRPTGGDP